MSDISCPQVIMTCPCNRWRHTFLSLRNRLYEEQMQTQVAIIDAIIFHSLNWEVTFTLISEQCSMQIVQYGITGGVIRPCIIQCHSITKSHRDVTRIEIWL
jgi:hypothetical protein